MKAFWMDESGQGLTEYALIIALVAVALIGVLIVFRNQIGGVFDRASTELTRPWQRRSGYRKEPAPKERTGRGPLGLPAVARDSVTSCRPRPRR
jgi:pilus assembly protein Flp/PilA